MELSVELSNKLLNYIRVGNVEQVDRFFRTIFPAQHPLTNFKLTYQIDEPTSQLLEYHQKQVKGDLVSALLLNAFQNQDKLFLCAWKNGLNQTLSPNDRRKYIGAVCGVAVQYQNIELYEIARQLLHDIFEPNRICQQGCAFKRACLSKHNQQVRYH